MWFNTIKRYYDNKHTSYTNDSLKVFVKVDMLTANQYEEITGIEYAA